MTTPQLVSLVIIAAVAIVLTVVNVRCAWRVSRGGRHVLVVTPEQWDEMCEQVVEIADLEEQWRRS